jgi:hypothetical protein
MLNSRSLEEINSLLYSKNPKHRAKLLCLHTFLCSSQKAQPSVRLSLSFLDS